jgi:hypothetical protein
MSDYYILDDDHNLIPVDLMTWARWYDAVGDGRIVAKTPVGSLLVSTVFLGSDHNFIRVGPAQLFKTMIFAGDDGGDCWRCATWQEAEAQHARTVAAMQQMLAAQKIVEGEAENSDDAD